ncbi:hypothetical protein AG1IA_07912 [Rhizoctonia solani AG-1 IA]|uniref:Uncharacterized protein n=1 Tax=Thanatephorus cucumeris (strain AG1-IA) TaxID=983506 RepID=L8WJG9_THACA|nr:hypothetical protein AG1IA_07912 [Rhizoctonia solani AG-1 IA]
MYSVWPRSQTPTRPFPPLCSPFSGHDFFLRLDQILRCRKKQVTTTLHPRHQRPRPQIHYRSEQPGRSSRHEPFATA